MKKLSFVLIICLLFLSCKKQELTQEIARPIIEKYYGLKSSKFYTQRGISNKEHEAIIITQVAIDKIYDDYGWIPKKYKKLEQSGIISLHPMPSSDIGADRVEVILSKDGEKCLQGKRLWHTQTNGDIEQYIFIGYEVGIANIILVSNAKEKTAEAEVIFKISNQSIIQQIFNPVKETEFKQNVKFKFSEDCWKIVEDEKSKLKIIQIDNPLHWTDL